MIVFLAVAALLVAAIALFMNRPEFGRAPRGERLERIWRSPNYRDGAFRNRHATPQLTSGKGWWATMYDFLFERKERNRPDHALPAVKTDLKALDPKENLLVWFGHSSYLIQADGLRILVDPVFETASPLPFFNRPFEGTDLYKPEDMPGIDLLVITHDHWDHLDYGTVTKLRDRTGRVVCPLGVGEYFEYWGFDPQRITELDWGEQAALGGGFTVYCRPARHFSGRTFRANRTLWASFVVETPSQRIFLGGDGGYDTHFADVAREFPNLDVAVLEDGQYSEDWRYIHMLPGRSEAGRRGPRRPAGFSGAQFQIRSGAASLGRAAEQCGCTRGGESRGGDRAAANRRAGTFGPVRHAAGQVVDSSRKLKESEDQPSLSFFIFLRYSRRYFLP